MPKNDGKKRRLFWHYRAENRGWSDWKFSDQMAMLFFHAKIYSAEKKARNLRHVDVAVDFDTD